MRIEQILADNMRRYRAAANLSQEALAHDSGLHRTYISGIERCVRNPSLKAIEKIARSLGVKPYELLISPDDGR